MSKHIFLSLLAGLFLIQGISIHAMSKRHSMASFHAVRSSMQREWNTLRLARHHDPQPDEATQRRLSLDPRHVNMLDYDLRNALNTGRLNMALFLIMNKAREANLTMQDDNGNTLLHLLAEEINIELLQKLYNQGHRIDPNIPNNKGETVFHILARIPYEDAAYFATLLLWDVHPNHTPVNIFAQYKRKTPLEIAASCNNHGMVKMLLELTPINHESVQKAIKYLSIPHTTTREYLLRHSEITRYKQGYSYFGSLSRSAPTYSTEHKEIEEPEDEYFSPIDIEFERARCKIRERTQSLPSHPYDSLPKTDHSCHLMDTYSAEEKKEEAFYDEYYDLVDTEDPKTLPEIRGGHEDCRVKKGILYDGKYYDPIHDRLSFYSPMNSYR